MPFLGQEVKGQHHQEGFVRANAPKLMNGWSQSTHTVVTTKHCMPGSYTVKRTNVKVTKP